MTMNDFDNQLILSGDHEMWGGGRYTSISVINPATGIVVDTWIYISNSWADTTTALKKQYVSGKQFFFLGINANTDPIFYGKIKGGLFRINQTYGYEGGYFLGTAQDNRLLTIDVDLYENYYCGWERYWQEPNTTAWMWKQGWGGWEYDIVFGKISTSSDSL